MATGTNTEKGELSTAGRITIDDIAGSSPLNTFLLSQWHHQTSTLGVDDIHSDGSHLAVVGHRRDSEWFAELQETYCDISLKEFSTSIAMTTSIITFAITSTHRRHHHYHDKHYHHYRFRCHHST